MSAYKYLLAIDASMNGCGAAALGRDGCESKIVPMASGQAEHLMPMIGEVLEEAGLAYKDLEALVTTLGPGAFTGLRIGLSTAKALAMSLDIPLFGVTTFQALALAYAEKGEGRDFSAIIETKRTDFYIQRFDPCAKPLSTPQALSAQDVTMLLKPEDVLIGDGAARYQSLCGAFDGESLRPGYNLPDMALVLRCFQEHRHPEFFTQEIVPLYLRGADVSEPKTRQRVLSDP